MPRRNFSIFFIFFIILTLEFSLAFPMEFIIALGLFWDKFLVENRKIVKALPAKFIQTLQKRGKVIIRGNLCPFPSLIITLKNLLEDWEYMASLREKLNLIKECSRVYSSRG